MFDSISDALSGAIDKIARPGELTERNIREGLREVKRALLEADVNFKVVNDFIGRVEEKAIGISKIQGVQPTHQIQKIVHDELVLLMGPIDTRIKMNDGEGPTIIMMVGLQGAGKTTTCAKLARLLERSRNKRPLLVAADLQRPAAIEQLKVLGESINVPVYSEQPKEGGLLGIGSVTPPKVCVNAIKYAEQNGRDLVIIDTAGRLQIDDDLMKELEQIKKKTKPQNIFFVCDAMTGQDAVNSAKGFDERLDVSGIVLTKLDGDARGGAALSIKSVTGKTIKFVGEGERIEDFSEFRPEGMADRILQMGDIVGLVNIAQQHIDQEKAETSAQRLMDGRWNFEDFLEQLETISKMGPLKKIIGMMPGLGSMLKGVDISDDELKPIKAIISSMSRQERKNPDLLNGSRRRRIAIGSGTSIPEVNALIKQFKMMKKMTSTMSQLGGMGSMFSGAGIQKMMSQMPGGMAALGQMGGGGGSPLMGGAPKKLSSDDRKKKKALRKQRKKNRKK
jgi:signal recognition particle subunit SRP54